MTLLFFTLLLSLILFFSFETDVIYEYGNLLKLKTVEGTKSVYPMLDEFGLTYLDHFIFKSSWDTSYHLECGFSRVQTSAVAINPKINSNILVRSIDQKSSD